MTPTVSIIIPCYNQAHYLGQTLESALNQSYSCVEVIVVNDGSTDNTAHVASQFLPQIVYIEQANAGLSAARNSGLERATGNFVVFLDSDDLLQHDMISKCLLAIKASEAQIAICSYETFREETENRLQQRQVVVPHHSNCLAEILCETGFAVHCAMVDRELLPSPRPFDERLPSNEDLDLWWRLALLRPRTIRVSEVGALYRQHSTSMSRNRKRMWETRAHVLTRYAEALIANRDLIAICGRKFAADLVGARHHLIFEHSNDHLLRVTWEQLMAFRAAGCGYRFDTIMRLLGPHLETILVGWVGKLFPDRFSEPGLQI